MIVADVTATIITIANNIMPLISAGYTDLSPPTAPKTAQDAYPRFLAIRRQFDDNFVSILRSLLLSDLPSHL